jgi:phosphate-selective porin OprO/OprP
VTLGNLMALAVLAADPEGSSSVSGGGVLTVENLGHIIEQSTDALPSSSSPSARISLQNQIPVPTSDSSGPERLKQEVRITVQTNAASGAVTNAVNHDKKSFQWKFSWEGWNGLHSDLSATTPIKEPKMLELREKIQGTNTQRAFQLEELKMSGKIGAKLQLDAAAYATGDQFKGFDDGIEVRRLRVDAKGDCILLMPVSYEVELGYIPNRFYIENSYLALRLADWMGDLKFGQYQPPMGLEAITSSRDITLMETAAPVSALAPGTSAGFEIGRPVFDRRATWKFGLFTSGVGNDTGDATANYARAISRLTGLPVYQTKPDHPDSTTLLHLGLSANVLYSASSSVRYRSRPESHLAPFVVDTGNINADGALVAGAEAAWVNGPFSVQGEYLRSCVKERDGQWPNFGGVYATASWFLTGESRPYDRQNACFTRVIPHRNFDCGQGGWGAFEVAARYSFVNLNSADINGGKLSELMTGVNWYLHSHLKWRFEYGLGHVRGGNPKVTCTFFNRAWRWTSDGTTSTTWSADGWLLGSAPLGRGARGPLARTIRHYGRREF